MAVHECLPLSIVAERLERHMDAARELLAGLALVRPELRRAAGLGAPD